MNTTALATTLCSIATILVANPTASGAWVYASDLYPYCQVTSSSFGGMNCYISSREQCEYRELCINNPRYLGAEKARVWKRKNKPEWRWW